MCCYYGYQKKIGGCCKGCPDREIGCHDRCEKYQEAVKEHLELKHKISEARKKDTTMDSYHKDLKERLRKER